MNQCGDRVVWPGKTCPPVDWQSQDTLPAPTNTRNGQPRRS